MMRCVLLVFFVCALRVLCVCFACVLLCVRFACVLPVLFFVCGCVGVGGWVGVVVIKLG